MKPRQRRLLFVAVALVAVVAAAMLITTALRNNIAYFFSPSQVKAGEVSVGKVFRLGGMVRVGSLQRQGQSLDVSFVVTDNQQDIKVMHHGILPDLFKEGKGVVAKGRLNSEGLFVADEVLAKHDENYMPPEVAATLKTKTTQVESPR